MVLASRKTFMLIFFVSVFENECLNYALDKNYKFASQVNFFFVKFLLELGKNFGKKTQNSHLEIFCCQMKLLAIQIR